MNLYRRRNVRFTPKSGHWSARIECPLCAKSGLMHRDIRRKTLFDHLVGAQQERFRNGQSNCLCSLYVDN